MGLSKILAIVLDWIGTDFIHLDPAVSELFCFKHDAKTSVIIIFISNPDVSVQQSSPQRHNLIYVLAKT